VQTHYNADPITVAIPKGLAPDRVQEIVEYTFDERRWIIVDSSRERITATLQHQGIDAEVVAEITDRTVKFMDYSADMNGDKVIALGWVEVLEKDLKHNFQRTRRRQAKDVFRQ
jgi:hypothetical protein